ncbi:MAG: transposase [Verrucomicrobiaceae bacterium]|nr:transposase [Verrucomicrobiaceae bacterium]
MRIRMTTYTDITYHIVFATKHRVRALDKARRDELFRFMWGVVKERHCHLYRIGGVEDHVHILTSLHPTVALADLIKEIKTASSAWIKGGKVLPFFEHWQEGYAAFTVAADDRPALIGYIKNQEEHHKMHPFGDELKALVEAAHLEWKAEYLP